LVFLLKNILAVDVLRCLFAAKNNFPNQHLCLVFQEKHPRTRHIYLRNIIMSHLN